MHKLMKAFASQKVTVQNATAGEISLHYPEIGENNYPTGLMLRFGIPAKQIIVLTDTITLKSLKMSSNLKKLVKARHLRILL